MRALPIATLTLIALAGCSKSPDDKRVDEIRRAARSESSVIKNKAENQADRLDREAASLESQAEQAGGLSGERIKVRSQAAAKEARLIRKQADMQTDALNEAAEAKVKAIKSR